MNSVYKRAFPVYKVLYFFYKRISDRGKIRLIRKWVRPGMTAIDVGANIGFYTMRLSRLVGEYPESPFLDEAARELARLGDRSVVPVLRARLREGGPGAEVTARALAEFGEEEGLTWLEEQTGERPEPASRPAEKGDELAELREQVRRLRKQVDEALELLKKLLAKRTEEDR